MILVAQVGPVCLNLGRMNPKLGKRWRVSRHGKSICFFFGFGSIAWWEGMRGGALRLIHD